MNKNTSKQKITFPKGFLWGTATSAHQIEGGNNNNWSEWEKENAEKLVIGARNKWQKWQQRKFPEMFDKNNYISGRATDHYNRFEEGFDIVQKLNNNAYRFSIEWSRIEPEKGKFNFDEIEHYKRVLQSLRKRGIKPMITLWHWTNPLWLSAGELNKKFPFYFSRYVECVVKELGHLVDFWLTLNEPTSVISSAYLIGAWPPQKRNLFSALKVYKNLATAHNLAYDKIHNNQRDAKVGFANIMNFYETAHKWCLTERLFVKIADYFSNRKFLNMTKGKHDFLTVQYYFHNRITFPGIVRNKNREVSDLGWEIYPQGIYHLLKSLQKYNLPIYITENGLADADDKKRSEFIKKHLFWIYKAITEGVDVRGYFYWSLLDNFEWDKGFWPRFGLVEIDYKTLKRTPRKSFFVYAKICKNNGFILDENKI